jgi:hypothetical protein
MNPIKDTPATQPITVIPAWNAPKQRAMMVAAYISRVFVVVPMASETAKQSIERPIPIRAGVRRSMSACRVGGESL